MEYGHDYGLEGSNFGEVQPSNRGLRLTTVRASIPQMSRPYKGVKPITQFFNPPRHRGADIGMYTGTPLYASHYGQVVVARQDFTGYGWVIGIKDDARGLYTVYGHLNYATGIVVRVGDWVQERQHIGYSDNTGNSTGPHLHVELRVAPYDYVANTVDPLKYMQVWDGQPVPPPTPPPTPPPSTSGRYLTLKQVWVIRKKDGYAIGQYPQGVTLYNAGNITPDGRLVYIPGQYGQKDGFVNLRWLRKL